MKDVQGAHQKLRRQLMSGAAVVGLAAMLPSSLSAMAATCKPSSNWLSFVGKHISADGRVIDFSNPDQRTTSEGQSYALFFALVENDPVLFARVLSWTEHNLCGGRVDKQLPAWLWGKDGQDQWRVLDDNSASDADLWIAYALLEASRLWNRPEYAALGRVMLKLIGSQEVADLPGLGPMLLPGRLGFVQPSRWLLNPSYVPLQLLRRFAVIDPGGQWASIIRCAVRMQCESAPVGFAPDWIVWDGSAFVVDPGKGSEGSYDAIRVYLWAGMLAASEPLRGILLKNLHGPVDRLKSQGAFAEKFNISSGAPSGIAPIGFAAALLPYLEALNEAALLQSQSQRIPLAGSAAMDDLPYYDRMLILFGQGWLEGRYRFSADGRLLPVWRSSSCSAKI